MRGAKLLFVGAVLFFIGKQFATDLARPEIKQIELRPAWLLASGALYLLGNLPSAWFWRHLHGFFGYPVPIYAALRAHYIGQLGKYVPGKALAIWMRAALVHPHGVPYGVSIIASFYEVLTGMAAGAMVAAAIYAVDPPAITEELLGAVGLTLHPAWLGFLLMAVCGVPLIPGVFNFVVARLTRRLPVVQLYRLPAVRFGTLAIGLLTTGVGWWLQGLSVWAMLNAVLPEPPPLTLSLLAQCTAAIGFANAAGFVSMIPGGFGVREWLLLELLGFAGPKPLVAAAAIMLRLDWIVTEALVALCTYWPKPAGEQREPAGSNRI